MIKLVPKINPTGTVKSDSHKDMRKGTSERDKTRTLTHTMQ